MQPKTIVQGTVANSQGSFATGVTGSIKLSITGTNLFAYVGFCNPAFGSYKNYGEISDKNLNPKYGYDNSWNNSPKIMNFGGYKLQVNQVNSPIAQKAFVYILSKL